MGNSTGLVLLNIPLFHLLPYEFSYKIRQSRGRRDGEYNPNILPQFIFSLEGSHTEK